MPSCSPYLEYLNKLNISASQINSIEELSNGLYMHDILSGLKQFQNSYPYQIITQPFTFVHNIKNIKSLIKAIHQFWSNHVHQQVCYQVDPIKIAKDNSTKQIQKLVRLLVKTLFHTQDKHYFIEKVLQTSQQTQQFFMDLVKEQTSIEFTSPKNSKSNKNHHNSLYDKLLELEHQNEHLMILVEELAEQNYEYSQRQKEFEQKIGEKEAQISRLNWALGQVNEKKLKPQDSDLCVSRQRYVDEIVLDRMKQTQQRQKALLIELQKCKHEIKVQSEELRVLRRIDAELKSQKQENQILKTQNVTFKQQVSKLKQNYQQVQLQLMTFIDQSSRKSAQITSQQAKIILLSQQVSSKTQQIQQLQNNIRYLTEQKDEPMFRRSGSSIKEDCREINQPVLVRKKRQADKANKELRSALITVAKQEKEIQTLRVYREENKKLVQMISHMHNYRGQENQLLVHSLYKIRTQLLSKQLNQNTLRNPLAQIPLND